MKVVLVGVNSKYIHTNLAIRYLKANCRYPVDIIEFTIKDSIDKIIDNIIKKNPDVIGFSVYIWNIELIKKVLKRLKKDYPNKKIILGGPEVSYEYDEFLLDNLADFIISNEGEIAFDLLIDALAYDKDIKDIPNLSYNIYNNIIRNKRIEIKELNELNNPYKFEGEDYINKIQYIELSRGCPYKCAYCMASLEKRVRFFSLRRVKEDIKFLYDKGAKTFKFLDRTFNLKAEVALDIYQFIINNDFSNASFQFEINGDILTPEVLKYLDENCPKNRIRFEIGIQSTNKQVNLAVDRKQDNQKLFQNILFLNNTNVDLHLDLIAGLPYEDYLSFKDTFNQVYKLFGKELQLGFLKLLKGTKLFYEKDKYGYQIQKIAPYELVKNNYISEKELYNIHIVEETLEIYWNKGFMNNAIKKITASLDSPFDFLLGLGNYIINNNLSFHRYQLSDVFEILERYLDNEIKYDIRYDYLKYNNIKPKIYWDDSINKNETIRLFHKSNPQYNLDTLFKYSVVTKYYNQYLIVIYLPNKREMHII